MDKPILPSYPGVEKIEKIAPVGNPNVGKSVIFGWLTGKYVTVSNYPGTTVEVSQGNIKLDGRKGVLVDTPGTNNLIPMSEDERVTRDILLEEGDLRIIQVCDAKNLRRGLLITLQLAEMEKPTVLVLNMADEAKERGIVVDLLQLSELLGIPVLSTVATRRKGLDGLVSSLEQNRCPRLFLPYSPEVEANMGLSPMQEKSNQRGVENRGKSELQQREEVLEFLWTVREAGKSRLSEILGACPEEGIEEMLEAMAHDGWITIQDGEVIFQEEGEKGGLEVIRRHRLAERLLSEAFALEERDFETSACQFEHILSPQVLESVCSFLGHPPVCPHGKPIPPGPCCARFKREVEPLVRPLPDLKLGEEGRVVFITPKSKGRLERLSSLSLVPGSMVRLAQKRPSYVIEIGETTLALDEEIAKEIYVKRA